MKKINPYLNFNGNAEEAFLFYKSVFGGEFDTFMRFSEVPSDKPLSESESKKIMHVSLPISKETVLMGSDVPAFFAPVTMGNNFTISINTETEEETETLFRALSAGGNVQMPLEKTFWSALFGMLTDKFGISWMVDCSLPK